MMDSKGVNELLERYKNGQCTIAERRVIEEWFEAQTANGDWEWSELEKKATKLRIKKNVDRQLNGKPSVWPWLRIAAVFLLISGSVFLFRNNVRDLVDPVVMLEKRVGDGERLKLTLPDGSSVMLNAGTRFSYPNRFNNGKRQVYLLEGEAYFDVAHDPANPFMVHSKNVVTRVLGTAFNVKAYQYLSNLQVAVTRGKVRVSDTLGINSAVLLPNQQLTIDTRSGRMSNDVVDSQTVIAWQRGDLAFNNDRLVDVCAVLSKKYDLNFHFEQKDIQEYRITAGFVSKDKIDDIVSILAAANNLTVEQKGHNVFFKKQVKQ